MVDVFEFFKNFVRVIFIIFGFVVFILFLYFVYFYLEDELEILDMLRNLVVVVVCSFGVFYVCKYVLFMYGKVFGF